MNLKSGYPWWMVKNGLPFNYPKLETSAETEVVIVGSGISGALTAHFLCEAGVKCLIVDKRTACTGSTCASTCLLQYETDMPLFRLIEILGIEKAVKSYQLSLQSIRNLENIISSLHIDCDFRQRSSLYLASDKKGLRDIEKEYQVRQQYGLPVEFMTKDELQQGFNIKAPGALYNQVSADTDAYKLSHALLQHHIIHSGLKVFERTEVVKIAYEPDGVILHTADGLTVKAAKMVCAPGYESSFFLTEKNIQLNSTYALITEPVTTQMLWPEQCLIWETARPYHYLRTTPDNRIIIGGGDEKFKDPRLRDSLLERKTNRLMKRLNEVFPHIQTKADYYWCGTFAETKDSLPYIGTHKDVPHTYFALGYGGNGITFSVMAAELISGMYTGRTNGNETLFGFER
ncbi:FAD-dependent oxidoreductase [Pedobacter sp. BS3]|uniref:NAD(P)/FAD-dependent oxidoreductase n=1 Tax=Pedobacter sp. BS3 TaxID=2567937 RepID=UPI0011ED64C1|nr:FAD-dependent oxidoreductase [Pedobacter sp. BS3]TZF84969.1 FAD-dependent oxidoreductase [Pedobacter sp. BS3]